MSAYATSNMELPAGMNIPSSLFPSMNVVIAGMDVIL